MAANQLALQKEQGEQQLEMQWRIALLQNTIEEEKLKLQEKMHNAQLALQKEQGDQQLEMQWRIALLQNTIEEEKLKIQKEMNDAQLDLQKKQGEQQLEMQWRVALLQNELEEKKLELQKEIAEMQKDLLKAQAEAEDAKKELYRRQIKGFNEDYKQKILKITLDAWAVGFSVARDMFMNETGNQIPSPMQSTVITQLFEEIVYPELDKFEWKEGKHPDAENTIKLTKPHTKVADTEPKWNPNINPILDSNKNPVLDNNGNPTYYGGYELAKVTKP